MDAIVFQSEVKDDVIVIPEQYRGVFSSPVLVTIIRDIREIERKTAVKKNIEWLNDPWKIDGFKPLSREEIYARS